MELVILMGLQAAGKSSFYRARFAATHVHVSKDNFRNNSNPARMQQRLVAEALQNGRSIVVDNTNTARSERASLIEQGRAAGARVTGYYLASPLSGCMERNGRREGKARVPNIALFATAKRLEPPTYNEGYDELFYVSLTEGGTFAVSPWRRDETE